MSIQPLNNAGSSAYTPITPNRTASTPAASSSSITGESNDLPLADVPASDQKSIEEAATRANKTVEGLRSDLKFSVDDETGSKVVKLVDVTTNEVIRQIPAQEMLVIAKRLDELRGLLVKDQA